MMRILSSLLLAVLILGSTTAPAHADFPLSLRACGGLGVGSGHRDDLATSGPFSLLAADLAWDYRPGRAIVLSFEATGWLGGVSYVPESRHLDSVEHRSLVVGMEWSRVGSALEPYLEGGLGFGRVTTEGAQKRTSDGLALAGAAGVRIVPSSGPIGIAVGLRTSHVISENVHSGAWALTLGISIHPR